MQSIKLFDHTIISLNNLINNYKINKHYHLKHKLKNRNSFLSELLKSSNNINSIGVLSFLNKNDFNRSTHHSYKIPKDYVMFVNYRIINNLYTPVFNDREINIRNETLYAILDQLYYIKNLNKYKLFVCGLTDVIFTYSTLIFLFRNILDIFLQIKFDKNISYRSYLITLFLIVITISYKQYYNRNYIKKIIDSSMNYNNEIKRQRYYGLKKYYKFQIQFEKNAHAKVINTIKSSDNIFSLIKIFIYKSYNLYDRIMYPGFNFRLNYLNSKYKN